MLDKSGVQTLTAVNGYLSTDVYPFVYGTTGYSAPLIPLPSQQGNMSPWVWVLLAVLAWWIFVK
jgi:hypothetical protein